MHVRLASMASFLQCDRLRRTNCLAAFVGTAVGMGGMALAEGFVAPHNMALKMSGPFGALATLLYAVPAGQHGKSKNMWGGFAATTLVVVTMQKLGFLCPWPLPHLFNLLMMPSVATAVMHGLGVLHPPASAYAMVYAMVSPVGMLPTLQFCITGFAWCLWLQAVQLGLALTFSSLQRPSADLASAGCCADRPAAQEPTVVHVFAATLIALGALAGIEQALVVNNLPDVAHLLLGSYAATCALLYAAPAAALGAPQNTLGGHAISIGVALVIHYGMQYWHLPVLLEKVMTPAVATAAMLRLDLLHPPATATAIIFVMLKEHSHQDVTFLLPTLGACLVMLLTQYAAQQCSSIATYYLCPQPPLVAAQAQARVLV